MNVLLTTEFLERQRERLHRRLEIAENLAEIYPGAPEAFRRMKRRVGLAYVQAALEKMERGTYGLCDGCGGPIPTRRLIVVPGAVRCASCQEGSDAVGGQ